MPEDEEPPPPPAAKGKRPMSSKMAERAAMFSGSSPGSTPRPTERKSPSSSPGGTSVKERLAAMQAKQQQSPPVPPPTTSPGSGMSVKERLAAMKNKDSLPIGVGPPPAKKQPASQGGVAARMAALNKAGGLDMGQLAARLGAPPPAKAPSVEKDEVEEDDQCPKKPAVDAAKSRPTLKSGTRRKKTVRKMTHDGESLVEPIKTSSAAEDVKKEEEQPASSIPSSPPPPKVEVDLTRAITDEEETAAGDNAEDDNLEKEKLPSADDEKEKEKEPKPPASMLESIGISLGGVADFT